ncbi:hypothetical protein V5O48_005226 [Marasmius crinis-equi]|uniref:F-box domain-containing protein n=1 Tax=Marasmius crinis-equi TaxID=585013 RepID=A0ABR3FMX3_9AGAR
MRTCKLFYAASRRPFLVNIHWKDMAAFSTNTEQVWANHKTSNLRTIPRTVQVGGELVTKNQIRWDDIFPTLQTFSNLSSLIIVSVQFPLHDIFMYLESMPRLTKLSLSNIERDSSAPCNHASQLPSYSNSLRELTVKQMPMSKAPFLGDSGFMHIMDLLSRPGLERAEISMDTFADLLYVFDETRYSFSESLIYLDVRDPTFRLNDEERWQEDWCNLIHHAVHRCATVIQHLRIWSSSHPPDPPPPLYLPALIEYIGPHEMLSTLMFSSSISTIWVPAPVAQCSSAFKLSERLGAHLQHTDLRNLSVLRWSSSDIRVENIFALFPRLEELSIQPSSPLSKRRLSHLKGALKEMHYLRGISILNDTTRYKLSNSDQREILSSWKRARNTLLYVRFETKIKFLWDGKRTWEKRHFIDGQLLMPLNEERKQYTNAFCHTFLF